jgi:aspartate kinase
MIVQNVGQNGVANLTFTAPSLEVNKAKQALAPVLAEVGASLAVQDEFAKLSVVGVGMKTHSGVAATLFKTLADVGVNIDLISTSEIRITVAIDQGKADDAARAIHTAFGLDKA